MGIENWEIYCRFEGGVMGAVEAVVVVVVVVVVARQRWDI